MKLDRDYQRGLLQALYEDYPAYGSHRAFEKLPDSDEGKMKYVANMVYLEEEGLISSGIGIGINGPVIRGMPRLNHNGANLIKGDGGIAAVLGEVTVRFHTETLRELLETGILRHPGLTGEEKVNLSGRIKALPYDSIKHLLMKLLDAAVSRLPDAARIFASSL
jgi:hypothetical protein